MREGKNLCRGEGTTSHTLFTIQRFWQSPSLGSFILLFSRLLWTVNFFFSYSLFLFLYKRESNSILHLKKRSPTPWFEYISSHSLLTTILFYGRKFLSWMQFLVFVFFCILLHSDIPSSFARHSILLSPSHIIIIPSVPSPFFVEDRRRIAMNELSIRNFPFLLPPLPFEWIVHSIHSNIPVWMLTVVEKMVTLDNDK